jgi:hypothetical protein
MTEIEIKTFKEMSEHERKVFITHVIQHILYDDNKYYHLSNLVEGWQISDELKESVTILNIGAYGDQLDA